RTPTLTLFPYTTLFRSSRCSASAHGPIRSICGIGRRWRSSPQPASSSIPPWRCSSPSWRAYRPFSPTGCSRTRSDSPSRSFPHPGLSLSLGANLTLCGALVGVLLVMAIPRTAGPDTSDASAVGATNARGPGAFREDVTDAFLLEQLRAVSRMIPSPAEAVDDIPPTHADGCHLDFRDEEPKLCPYGAESDITVALVGDSKAN